MNRFAAIIALIVVVLAGCGRAGVPPMTEQAGGSGALVAALGDSITAGSPLWDPDPAVRSRIGPALDEKSSFGYWAHDALPGTTFRNCGVLGERTDQIAMRLDDCADGADALIVQGGINDIAQGRPVTDTAIDLEQMVERGLQQGLDVYLVEVLPWNNGGEEAEAPIAALNREITRIGAEQDIPVIPFHNAVEDPLDAARFARGFTDDGDHPSVSGYLALGRAVVKALE